MLVGSIVWIAGILGSAFSTELWHFFLTQVRPFRYCLRLERVSHLTLTQLTQGVLQGISCAMVFPIVVRHPSISRPSPSHVTASASCLIDTVPVRIILTGCCASPMVPQTESAGDWHCRCWLFHGCVYWAHMAGHRSQNSYIGMMSCRRCHRVLTHTHHADSAWSTENTGHLFVYRRDFVDHRVLPGQRKEEAWVAPCGYHLVRQDFPL